LFAGVEFIAENGGGAGVRLRKAGVSEGSGENPEQVGFGTSGAQGENENG